jgi:ribosome-associated protein
MAMSEASDSAQLQLAPGVTAPSASLRVQYARSGGPGGQNVNKLNSKAEIWLAVSAIQGLSERAKDRLRKLAGSKLTLGDEIHLSADTSRSQEMNREEVMDRLRAMIVEAKHEPKVRRKTKPSRAARQRRLDAKRKRGEVKANRRGPTGW